jgi:hypothetical protein
MNQNSDTDMEAVAPGPGRAPGNLATQLTNLKAGDMVIAVMGVTGSGKSSLISLLTSDNVKIGHGLESQTKHAAMYRLQTFDNRQCWLLDTPGFDDTFLSDTEVFQEIAWALTELASKEVLLSMVFLHRIIDVRFGGSARKSLRVFQLLCGDQAMKDVTLVSTFWDAGDREVLTQREEALIQEEQFWGGMMRNGARACRHLGTRDSAWSIVQPLLQKESVGMLQIQNELVQAKKTLGDTAAGQYLLQDSEKLQAKYEREIQNLRQETSQALQENDRTFAEELKREQSRLLGGLEILNIQRDRLGVRLKELQELQEQASKMVSKLSGEEN